MTAETPAVDPIPLDESDQVLLAALLGASDGEFAAQHFHPYANLFPLMDEAESDALGEAMAKNGQRDKIVMYQGLILDGRNRAVQLRKRGMTIHLRHFDPVKEGNALDFVIDANLRRRQLSESQRAMVAAKLANLGHGGARGEALPQLPIGPAAPPSVTQEQAAAALNVSERSLRSARNVQEEGVPELQAAVEVGDVTVSAAEAVATLPKPEQSELLASLPRDGQGHLTREAERAISKAAKEIREKKQQKKKERRHERERELGQKILAQPTVKAGFISADPEWDFKVYSRDTGMDRHASNHYPVSPDAAIHARRAMIDDIAADDSVLGLWTTDLQRGLDTMHAWGFEPKSYFVWVKDVIEITLPIHLRREIDADLTGARRLDRDDEQVMVGDDRRILVVVGAAGTGYWRRDRCELYLIGTRGSPVCPAMGEQGESVWFARRGEHAASRDEMHSDKPECSYEWVEKHFPNTPKIELNARRIRPGWIGWGNEVPNSEAEDGTAGSSAVAVPPVTSESDDASGCAPEAGEPITRHAASSEPASLACRAGDAGSLVETVSLTEEEIARLNAGMPRGLPMHASDVRADVDAPLYGAPHDLVTAASHPRLYEAFETISHDSGAGAGHPQYPVPHGIADLAVVEGALEMLDDEELETFCIGDENDAWDIARNSEELMQTRKFLDRFFEGFAPEPAEATA